MFNCKRILIMQNKVHEYSIGSIADELEEVGALMSFENWLNENYTAYDLWKMGDDMDEELSRTYDKYRTAILTAFINGEEF